MAADLSAPSNLRVNGETSTSSPVCKQTWDPSVSTDPSLIFNYRIYGGNPLSLLARDIQTTEYTFPKSICSTWTQPMSLQVCGYIPSRDQNTPLSNAITYTYRDSYTMGLYVNGVWRDCVAYYWDSANWRECVPHIYNNGWQECSTT